MNKVIITGANGYLGFNLTKHLIQIDTEVFALINNNNDRLAELNSDRLHIVNSINDELLTKEGHFDALYHLAWSGNSGNKRSDVQLQQENIYYACCILKKAAELNCSKFLFAGSIMEYEAISSLKQDIKPGLGNIYSASKLTADIYLKTLSAQYNIPYICLLISNIFGPGERNPRLINSTLKKFINNEETAFSECTQLYDFIYIDDAIRKFIELGDKADEGEYYIGNPEQKPLNTFIETIGHICGKNIDEIGIGKLGKTNQIISYDNIDTAKIEKEFGLQNNTSFAEGISKTKEYIEGELSNGKFQF